MFSKTIKYLNIIFIFLISISILSCNKKADVTFNIEPDTVKIIVDGSYIKNKKTIKIPLNTEIFVEYSAFGY